MGYRRTYRIHKSGDFKTDPDLNSNHNPIPKLTLTLKTNPIPKLTLTLTDTGGHTEYMKVASLKLTLTLTLTLTKSLTVTTTV